MSELQGTSEGKSDGKWGHVTFKRDGTFAIATEGTMEGKLVAARGYTTKKQFVGKLSETFCKEALAALFIQPTTIAHGRSGLVKDFYFSLNFDVVPKSARVPLFNKLIRSEPGCAIQFSLPTDEPTVYQPLKVENVVKVYEGQAETCRCGCAEEYYYNPAFNAEINARNAEREKIPLYPEERTKESRGCHPHRRVNQFAFERRIQDRELLRRPLRIGNRRGACGRHTR
jgi:hypothetical protein